MLDCALYCLLTLEYDMLVIDQVLYRMVDLEILYYCYDCWDTILDCELYY